MAYFKLFLVFLSIFIFTLSYLFILIFIWPLSSLARHWQAFILKNFSKSILLIFGIRVISKGCFPNKPFLLVSNHLSYLDIMVYSSLADCTFLAKSDVAGWPIIGKIISLFGTLYIDRSKRRDLLRVIPLIARRLQAGSKICFFPEGTSSDGKEVQNFYPALFECAVRAQCPVVVSSLAYYAAAQNKRLSVHEAVCWWGDSLSFLRHCLELAKVSQIIAHVNVSPKEFYHQDFKALSQICRQELLRIFSPSQDIEDIGLMKKKLGQDT